MLVFSNRLALKAQQEHQAFGTDIACMTYQKMEYNVYLNGLWTVQNSVPDLMQLVEQEFDYIVLDEAHYLFQDAAFNRRTSTIFEMIERFRTSKVIIMLSATADLLKEYFSSKITATYTEDADYSYIESVSYYNKKDTLLKILDNIPTDEKVVVFGDNKERLQELNRRYSNSAYLSSDNKETSPVFNEIVQTERFECGMLFTTKVLDNGINLKDKAIKHIIIEQTDMVEFMQCLGRKRIQDKEDTVKLYFYDNFPKIAGLYSNLARQMQVAATYFQLKEKGLVEDFRNAYRVVPLPYFFDNRSDLIFPTYYKAKHDYKFCRAVTKKETSLHQQVAIALQKDIVPYGEAEKHYALLTYLKQNLKKRFFKSDREELIKMFNVRDKYRLQKTIGVLNQYLLENKIMYELQSGQTDRDEGRKKYWFIVPRTE